jgi:PIN domain
VSAFRRREKNSLFKILIDTCVWLDLAKDYQQQPILTALEELIRMGDIELILPRTVLDEFARNKGRVVEESSRSLSGTMKRVKEAVEKFGDPRKKSTVLRQLNDVDRWMYRFRFRTEILFGLVAPESGTVESRP